MPGSATNLRFFRQAEPYKLAWTMKHVDGLNVEPDADCRVDVVIELLGQDDGDEDDRRRRTLRSETATVHPEVSAVHLPRETVNVLMEELRSSDQIARWDTAEAIAAALAGVLRTIKRTHPPHVSDNAGSAVKYGRLERARPAAYHTLSAAVAEVSGDHTG